MLKNTNYNFDTLRAEYSILNEDLNLSRRLLEKSFSTNKDLEIQGLLNKLYAKEYKNTNSKFFSLETQNNAKYDFMLDDKQTDTSDLLDMEKEERSQQIKVTLDKKKKIEAYVQADDIMESDFMLDDFKIIEEKLTKIEKDDEQENQGKLENILKICQKFIKKLVNENQENKIKLAEKENHIDYLNEKLNKNEQELQIMSKEIVEIEYIFQKLEKDKNEFEKKLKKMRKSSDQNFLAKKKLTLSINKIGALLQNKTESITLNNMELIEDVSRKEGSSSGEEEEDRKSTTRKSANLKENNIKNENKNIEENINNAIQEIIQLKTILEKELISESQSESSNSSELENQKNESPQNIKIPSPLNRINRRLIKFSTAGKEIN